MPLQTILSIDPSTGKKIWEGVASSVQDVDQAFKKSTAAFQKWRTTPFIERVSYLKLYQAGLRKNKEALAKTISYETGKPLWESLREIDAMIAKVTISEEAYLVRSGFKETQVKGTTLQVKHHPWGIVGVLGPFNFPGHLPNGHFVPALLAGNCVIFKPSEYTSRTALEIQRIMDEAEIPDGVFQTLLGGSLSGEAILKHPCLDLICFTGSVGVGKKIATLLNHAPHKILALEMGGNNPLVIGNISDIESAIQTIIESAFLTTGQRCTSARRLILVENDSHHRLIEKLVEKAKALKIGRFDEKPEPFMGPVISEKAAHHLLNIQENRLSMGADPYLAMTHLKEGTGFVTPAILDVSCIKTLPDEEVFGPFLQVTKVKTFQQAINHANSSQFGLSAALLSDSQEEWQLFYDQINAGIINWNCPTNGASSESPFGGIGLSGNGRPAGFYSADYCSYPVASQIRKRMQPSQLPGMPL